MTTPWRNDTTLSVQFKINGYFCVKFATRFIDILNSRKIGTMEFLIAQYYLCLVE